ncbi:MAG: prolyl oligopeptidase family serine peptidase [Pseudomonadota bacterium]
MTALPTLTDPDNDPHLWLEEIEAEKVLSWVAEQNQRTLEKFDTPMFREDRDALTAILDTDQRIPYVRRKGEELHHFWRDKTHERGIWRRTTQASYQSDNPEWEILLDVDALAEAEGEDWVFSSLNLNMKNNRYALVRLSRGGSDATVLREYDMKNQEFVEDGFFLEESKTAADWINEDTLLLTSSYGENMATTSGYGRTARKWKRGQPVEEAEVLFETDADKLAVWSWIEKTRDPQTIFFTEQLSFFDINVWMHGEDGTNTKLDLPTDITVNVYNEHIAVMRKSDWELDGQVYPAGSVLIFQLKPLLEGNHVHDVIFEPEDRIAVQYFFWNNGRPVLMLLDNLEPKIKLFSKENDSWNASQLPDLPEVGVVHTWRFDTEENSGNDDLLLDVQTPIEPSTLYLWEDGKAPAVLKRAPKTFDADGLNVSKHEAVSTDGERIPYFQIGPETSDGNAPVHMLGYGGFQMSELPYYRSSIGKLWLEKGGTSVITNIRGGGEFGPEWHEAGKREKKMLSHDDFAAIAADIVTRGVTTPERIAAEGGSNGGILISNMLTRYPERFGALFCTIPLIDMRRYNKLLAGASWVAEYGDPDKAEDWDYLQHYSAYHNVEAGSDYPPILIATTRKDDRVHPGHARKFTAKLHALGHEECYYHELDAGGHSYGKNNAEAASFSALGFNFLRRMIGWE